MVQSGQLAQAEPLFEQILTRHTDSRFARRLQTDGFPVVEAAQAATVFMVFGVGALLFSKGE
jgi:tRNA A22 N-methylase